MANRIPHIFFAIFERWSCVQAGERFNGVIEVSVTHIVRHSEVEFFRTHQSTIKYKLLTLINQILGISASACFDCEKKRDVICCRWIWSENEEKVSIQTSQYVNVKVHLQQTMLPDLFWLALVRQGELGFLASSNEESWSQKQGCSRASAAVILSRGLTDNILFSKLRALGSMLLYFQPYSLIFISLFFLQTSSYLLPSKRAFLVSKMWKITPAEKMSHSGSMCLLSFSSMISGATQPGVPHLKNRYLSRSTLVARPKSTMTGDIEPFDRSIMFSGFRSRCMILCSCICLSPPKSPYMNSLTCSAEKKPLACWILWKSCPPLRSSKTTQIELSDSQTPSSLRMLGCQSRLSCLMILSSLIRLSFPFLPLKQLCLEKALTANLAWSVMRSTSQTEAKLPFPSFLRGLNIQWKPFWLIFLERQKIQASMTLRWGEQKEKEFCSSQKSLIPILEENIFFQISHRVT